MHAVFFEWISAFCGRWNRERVWCIGWMGGDTGQDWNDSDKFEAL